MKKKQNVTAVIMIVLALLVAACGGGNNAGPNAGANANGGNNGSEPAAAADNAPAANDKAEEPAEDVTIKMMHLWPEGSSKQQHGVVQRIIAEYEQANPHVTVETEILENEQYKNKLKVLSASNDLPDVGFSWAAGFLEPYVKGSMFAPLDDLLSGDLNGQFVAGTTEAYAVDGKTYALPVELNIVPVYYNKAIFEENGLTPPETLDDLKNIVTTLSGKGIAPAALGGKDAWTASFWYMYLVDRIGGGTLLDESIASNTFSDPGLVEAAKVAQELVDLKAFVKGFNGLSNDEAKSEFMNGKAAMYAMGTWEVPNFTTNPDVPQEFKDKVGFFKFPTIAGGKGEVNNWVGGPGVGLFVAENSSVKDEAKKFVSFFVKKWGEISVTDAGIIPATKVDTSAIQLPQMFIDLLNELSTASKVTLYADVQMKPVAAQEHYNLVQALLGKAVTPEEFAAKQEEALKAGK